jgi:glycine/D-amino acid oxidase-like deaminating enzyme
MLKFSGGALVQGASRARPVAGSTESPSRADVVVIGGGLIGCITALNLAERGASVCLCEKGVIAGEASGRAAGGIEYQYLAPVKMELTARSLELWRAMPDRIGADIGFCDRGAVTLFESAEHGAQAEKWLGEVRGLPGVKARLVPGEEVPKLDAALGAHWHSALLQENAASVEPKLAAPAIAEAAVKLGATVVQGCAVNDVTLQNGRIDAVSTERGVIKTSNVVIAGGVWSPQIARILGLEVPQLMIFAEMISVDSVKGGPAMFGMTPAGYFRREPDGGYMFGTATGCVPITPTLVKYLRRLASMQTDVEQEMNPVFNLRTFLWELGWAGSFPFGKATGFQRNRVFQPEVVGRTSTDTFEGMRKHIPAFRDSSVRERYAGALMTTIDNLGVISAVEHIPGLYLGTGMLYGLTMSAAAGEALADLVAGEPPKCDLSPYRYSRFVDGSELVFHP